MYKARINADSGTCENLRESRWCICIQTRWPPGGHQDMAAVDEASSSAQALISDELETWADSGQINPKHKIFLSHSGADKNFVWHLCGHLETVHHYPFFDVREDSLPKGEKFPQLIFQAAQQCQVAILVVSENFFMGKWPMLELASFVEAQKSNNPSLKILPLFYGLTVAQFREPERQDRWFKEWEKLADSDTSGRIDTSKWKAALKVVGESNGLEFVYGQSEVVYIKKIVEATCKLVPVDMRWNESHVQGQRHLRSAVQKMFEDSVPSVKVGCRVVGLYGVGGTGKTTLCKTLCNGFFPDFAGKVCHLEIRCKTKTPIDSQKEVLQALTEASDELLKKVTEFDKGQYMYAQRIGRQKVFLTLDNVLESTEALSEAAAYLEAKFSPDSKILVTARSLDTLLSLGINRDCCFEMPHLEEKDAMALFLHYAQPGRSLSAFTDSNEREVLRRCVRCALYGKGVASTNTSERHFHPLALKVLGLHFVTTSPFPLAWIKKLDQFDLKRFGEVGYPIFSVLRTSYDALPTRRHRNMFLDVVIYAPRKPDNTAPTVKQLCKWLSIVYEETFVDVLASLEVLSSRALLDHWNNLSEAVSIHDLYREFAEDELRGDNEDPLRLFHQGVDIVPKLLRKNPVLGNCLPFERICLCHVGVESFDEAKLRSCSNLEVLKLDFCHALPSLSLQGLKELRSLELYGCFSLRHLLHSIELESLAWMRWNTCNFLSTDMVFSTSLQILELFGLSKRSLVEVPPDIRGCKFMREITLKNFSQLRNFPQLSGLNLLRKVDFGGCTKVESLILEDQCSLRKINLQNCKNLEVLWLPPACSAMTKIKCKGCESLVEFRNIADCRNLRVLDLEGCESLVELRNIADCRNLRVLDLEGCQMLTCRQLADIPSFNNLTHLNVSNCTSLVVLPDLSKFVFSDGHIGLCTECTQQVQTQWSLCTALNTFVYNEPLPGFDYRLILLKSEIHKNHVPDLLSMLHYRRRRYSVRGECSLDTRPLLSAGNMPHIVAVIDTLWMDETLGSWSFVTTAIAGFEESNRIFCSSQSGLTSKFSNWLTRPMSNPIMKNFRDISHYSPGRVMFALCDLNDHYIQADGCRRIEGRQLAIQSKFELDLKLADQRKFELDLELAQRKFELDLELAHQRPPASV